jgi:site-specific recombinase XerD
MPKINTKAKDNPKLCQNTLKDGRVSLYLEYYLGYAKTLDTSGKAHIKHARKKESLNLYLDLPARTPQQRQKNKDTIELAQKIRSEKEQEFRQNVYGYRLNKSKNINFLDYFQSFIDSHSKKNKAIFKTALTRFQWFLKEKYPIFSQSIRMQQLNREMMTQFVDFLQSKSKGMGAGIIYRCFKRVINSAIEHNLMAANPCAGVRCVVNRDALQKDILSAEEIKCMMMASFPKQNENVRRAFIFSLFTGIRFCDIKKLLYNNVDFSNKILKFDQNKTAGHSAASFVTIPLNAGLLKIIGMPHGSSSGHIFDLPTYAACTVILKKWTQSAGISKHITWHCARHSFAMNILTNGANVKTVASLLGHSGLQYVEKYTRAIDELKEKAINSLEMPDLMLQNQDDIP